MEALLISWESYRFRELTDLNISKHSTSSYSIALRFILDDCIENVIDEREHVQKICSTGFSIIINLYLLTIRKSTTRYKNFLTTRARTFFHLYHSNSTWKIDQRLISQIFVNKHRAKYQNFISFPGVWILWKCTISADFRANRYRNNFPVHTFHGFFRTSILFNLSLHKTFHKQHFEQTQNNTQIIAKRKYYVPTWTASG